MKQIVSAALISTFCLAPSAVQSPAVIHSEKPKYPHDTDRITFTETHSYGVIDPADHPEAWLRVTDISPGPENGILVTDNRYHRVDLVVPDKGVTVSYGIGNGAGPGELGQPWAAAYDHNERIYISELGNVRISVFGLNGDFLRIIKLDHIPARVVAGNNQDLWVGRSSGIKVDTVDKYDSETGQLVLTVGDRYLNEDWYREWRHQPFLARSNEGVIVSTRYPTDLVEYDINGVNTRILSREHKWLTPPELDPDLPGGRIWNLINGQVRNVASFPDGMLASLMFQKIKRGRNTDPINLFILDLISTNGEWLYSIPVEYFGREWWIQSMTVANDGSIWFGYVDDEGICRVVRYEIAIVGLH